MLRILRSPIAFLLLTALLVGWLGVWLAVDHRMGRLQGRARDYQQRPLYTLAAALIGYPQRGQSTRVTPDQSGLSYSTGGRASRVAVKTPSGVFFDFIFQNWPNSQMEYNGEPILAAGYMTSEVRQDTFGLIAPVLTRTVLRPVVNRYHPHPLIELDLAVEAHNAYDSRPKWQVPTAATSRWSFRPKSAAHDAIYLLVLLVWFACAISIPKWPLWRRLTPAQRRRARGACPTCGYSLAGLPSTTCPECGSRPQTHGS